MFIVNYPSQHLEWKSISYNFQHEVSKNTPDAKMTILLSGSFINDVSLLSATLIA
ncbi:MAG: hypothetical protein ABI863_12110 [Ginsengibacter sp.]